MPTFRPAAALAFVVLIGCSAPELEQRETKITMAPWPKQTNTASLISSPKPRTLREAREARGNWVTAFPAYDNKVTGGIRKRWWALTKALPQQRGEGRVVLDFKLTFDGQVKDLVVTATTMPDIYVVTCKKAVLDGVPYDPWPADMRKLIGSNQRDVTMTFYYYESNPPPRPGTDTNSTNGRE